MSSNLRIKGSPSMLSVRRLEADIRGMRVIRAYRSVSSMIHFGLAERTTGTDRNDAYWMMVETARWTLEQRGSVRATDNSLGRRIDLELRRLIGRRLMRAYFTAAISTIDFETGLQLTLSPCTGEYEKLDNWTLLRGQTSALTLSRRGRLSSLTAGSSS